MSDHYLTWFQVVDKKFYIKAELRHYYPSALSPTRLTPPEVVTSTLPFGADYAPAHLMHHSPGAVNPTQQVASALAPHIQGAVDCAIAHTDLTIACPGTLATPNGAASRCLDGSFSGVLL